LLLFLLALLLFTLGGWRRLLLLALGRRILGLEPGPPYDESQNCGGQRPADRLILP
jgi:uncharacterized membrane protein